MSGCLPSRAPRRVWRVHVKGVAATAASVRRDLGAHRSQRNLAARSTSG